MFAVIKCPGRVELYVDEYPMHLAIAVDAFSILISTPFLQLTFPNTSLNRYDAQSNQSVSFAPFHPFWQTLPTSPPLLPTPKPN